MPNVLTISDNSSLVSSVTSFSTALESMRTPPHQLRRQRRARQLRRWVSKRLSRSSLNGNSVVNELTEKNLVDFNLDAQRGVGRTITHDCYSTSANEIHIDESAQAAHPIEQAFEEDLEATSMSGRVPTPLQGYYIAFCHEFTLSGPPCTKRIFNLTMDSDMEGYMNSSNHVSILDASRQATRARETSEISPTLRAEFPICQTFGGIHGFSPFPTLPSPPRDVTSHTLLSSGMSETEISTGQIYRTTSPHVGDLSFDAVVPPPSHTHYPRPPSQIMTPFVYRELQLAAREQKQARRRKLRILPFNVL